MDGTKKNDMRQTTPKLFETGTEMCPVSLFNDYIERRPATAISPESPMYLTPIPDQRLRKDQADQVWYYRSPMGVNSLGKLVKRMCSLKGITGQKTNHSIRKTCVRSLADAGIPAHKIIKITGHKNVQSLQHYDRELSNDEHLKLSHILTSSTKRTSTITSSTHDKPSSSSTVNASHGNRQILSQTSFNSRQTVSSVTTTTAAMSSATTTTCPDGPMLGANRENMSFTGHFDRLFFKSSFKDCNFTFNMNK